MYTTITLLIITISSSILAEVDAKSIFPNGTITRPPTAVQTTNSSIRNTENSSNSPNASRELNDISASNTCSDCLLFGGDVQVYYWPSTGLANTTSSSILVDVANDFTFTSPSIYVAFRSLYATDQCGDVGPRYDVTTLGFRPGQLNTAIGWMWPTGEGGFGEGPQDAVSFKGTPYRPYIPNVWNVADWSEEKDCFNTTVPFWYSRNYGEIWWNDSDLPETCQPDPDSCYAQKWEVVQNPCSPVISIPTELFALNSHWTTCSQGISALFDPPYVLTSANGLQPLSITPAVVSATAKAQPVDSPSPSIAPSTTIAGSHTSNVMSSLSDASRLSPVQSHTQDRPQSTNNGQEPQSNDPALQDVQSSPGYTVAIGPAQTASTIIPSQTVAPTKLENAPIRMGTNTLTPGGELSFSGTTYSLPPAGGSIMVNGAASPLPSIAPSMPSVYVIEGQTMSAGGAAITISQTTYSIPTSGNAVIVNGKTELFVNAGSSTFMIGYQTLIAGGPLVSISGTIASLLPGGSSIVVDGSTQAINGFFGASTTISGVGGVILLLGGFATPSESAKSTDSRQGNDSSPLTLQANGGSKMGIMGRWAASYTYNAVLVCGVVLGMVLL